MNSSIAIPFALLFLVAAILFISGLFWFRKYTGLSADKGFLALLASVIAAGVQILNRMRNIPGGLDRDQEMPLVVSAITAGMCIVFAAAFALRLWGKWIGGKATAEESRTGQTGVQAWFSAANVVVGLALVILAWDGYDISPLLTAVVVSAMLAAYPLMRMESPALTPTPAPESMSGEREKIVAMLETGKITADECAELLQALGETSRPPARQVPLTSGQRLVLIGAALVALGFFLPWFVINPGKEATHLVSQMQSSVISTINRHVSVPSLPPGYSPFGQNPPLPSGYTPEITTGDISISGGDIGRGLGWAALALALGAALVPYVATTLDAATARTVRLLCLGVGGIIVLYLLTQNIRFVGIGLIVAVSGYALEIAGALRKHGASSIPQA